MEEGQGLPASGPAAGCRCYGLFPEIQGTVTLMAVVFELLFGLNKY